MDKNIKFAVWDKTESFISSIAKDLVSFTCMGILIYASKGNIWWTILATLLLVLFIMAKISSIVNTRYSTFSTKQALQKWVDALPDD